MMRVVVVAVAVAVAAAAAVVVMTQMGMSIQAVMTVMTMMITPMFINMWKATEQEAIRIIPLPHICWQQFEGNCGKP